MSERRKQPSESSPAAPAPSEPVEPVEETRWVREQMLDRLRFYAQMSSVGLDLGAGVESAPPIEPTVRKPVPEIGATKDRETLTAVREDLGDCTRCRLHEGRNTIVFGQGSPNADLMFVGEGPGFEEDRQGLAFVGPAGQLLTKIIEAIGMSRDDVFIANVVKCRPPNNRDPEPDEVSTCRPFLDRQIDSIQPKIICTLGRVAAVHLLQTSSGITRIRGQIFAYRGAKLIPTYHPAYLLRNPEKKRETWEDMKLVRSLLQS